ncbi:hypothetical protein [Roseateles sp.]|jgi:hypothetical protein|uniref:hypothetical protein n=1 Tax=Roseateles sp. TaxID=1971397 RepID=UPI003936296B
MNCPAKDEALNRANGQGFGGQATNNTQDSASGDALQEAITRMKARASQCGCSLHEMADGGYLLCRWGHCKEVPCLRAVGALLRRIGGQHG